VPGAVSETELDWAREQIATYKQRHPDYELFAATLRDVLEGITRELAPGAIVGARAKTIAGFGEKIWRKRKQRPVDEFTDLCGARVITRSAAEVEAVSEFIEDHFEIDKENSVGVSQRLRPTEFGYRSVHYVVSFKEGSFSTPEGEVEVPGVLLAMPNPRAEVQVRTILEHAWARVAHKLGYKAPFKVPRALERDLAGVAAVLEGADQDFARIEDAFARYLAGYETDMPPEELNAEIERLRIVLEHDPENARVAARIGRLAIIGGEWDRAIEALAPHADSRHAPVLKDLGVAICKKHERRPKSKEYRQGQRYLERAIATPRKDADALAALAGTWKGIDEAKAGEYYRRAFELDPSDPYAVGNHLEHEIVGRRDPSLARSLGPLIESAVERCREQAAVGMNLPWALYDMGKLSLLRGSPRQGLDALAKGLEVTRAPWMLEASLGSLDRLSVVRERLPGLESARRLLLLGLATGFPDDSGRDEAERQAIEAARAELRPLATPDAEPFRGPIVILAGGCDESVSEESEEYADAVLHAFRDFRGTIVTGAARQRNFDLIGEIRERYPGQIRAIGYSDPLQYWIDLFASGVHPSAVKVLGIGGGTIAATEYGIALALGTTVAMIEEGGRATSGLLADEHWRSAKLVRLPSQAETVRAYLTSPLPRPTPKLPPDLRETLARAIHEGYRKRQRDRKPPHDPALAPWEALRADFRESNRDQADHIVPMLEEIGCSVGDTSPWKLAAELTEAEIESMAEMEHGRWSLERLLVGWTWAAARDPEAKQSPYLVGWADLSDEAREYDRETIRDIPAHLARAGLEVRRQQ